MPSAVTELPKSARWKSVSLPNEHGGWGFLLEPLLLGLLLAPTSGGVFVAIATAGAFLTRHPFKLAWGDRQKGRRYARTALAERAALGYVGLAFTGMVAAIIIDGPGIMRPAVLAFPFALIQMAFDLRNESRHWLPELAGPIALTASAAVIVLAGGWTLIAAIGLWMILVARALPSILYVRVRLRQAKNQPVSLIPAIASHIAALAAMIALAAMDFAPLLTVAAMVLLLGRAAYGLSRYSRRIPPKIIGFQEIAYGLLTVAATALGFSLGI